VWYVREVGRVWGQMALQGVRVGGPMVVDGEDEGVIDFAMVSPSCLRQSLPRLMPWENPTMVMVAVQGAPISLNSLFHSRVYPARLWSADCRAVCNGSWPEISLLVFVSHNGRPATFRLLHPH